MIEIYSCFKNPLYSRKTFIEYFNELPVFLKDKVNMQNSLKGKTNKLASYILLKEALKNKGLSIENISDENLQEFKFENIYFSFSHSYDLVVCAVSDSNLGIDVEKIRNINFYLAKRKLGNEEKEFLKDKNKEAFFELWCSKEALLKYANETFSFLYNISLLNDKGFLKSPKPYESVVFNKLIISDYLIVTASEEKSYKSIPLNLAKSTP